MRVLAFAVLVLAAALLLYVSIAARIQQRRAWRLRQLDDAWATFSEEAREEMRGRGCVPSWEMPDDRLVLLVGPKHARVFRARHPAPERS